MAEPTAIYIDLTDPQSARAWRWLGALGLHDAVEVRPYCASVEDPWECDAPPLALELLMLMEQGREHGRAALLAVVDAAFERTEEERSTPVGELAMWLRVGAEAGLPLAEYDSIMERLRADVGYWMAEAREEHGVCRAPTVLFDDGALVHLQLDQEGSTPARARALLDRIRVCIAGVGSGPVGR